MSTYLLVNLLSIFIPFVASFNKLVGISRNFRALFLAISVSGIFFISWDILFTELGIWGFNPRHLSGIYLFSLPLGEWLFFICIPFACVFMFNSFNKLIKRDFFAKSRLFISISLIIGLSIVTILNLDKAYTSTVFSLTILFVIYVEFIEKPAWLSRFYFTFLFILIPFFIVNGILTGSGIEEEIVWYNNSENLGLRIGTIPIEDIFYGFSLVLMNVYLFEKWKTKPLESEE